MEGFNKKFLADVLKYYGFACSIPAGKCFLEIIFGNEVSTKSILISLAALLFGIILFMIGGIINKDE